MEFLTILKGALAIAIAWASVPFFIIGGILLLGGFVFAGAYTLDWIGHKRWQFNQWKKRKTQP